METLLLKKLGIVKVKYINQNFDLVYEEYKNKALALGYANALLKFIKEKNRVFIYLVISQE